MSSNVADWLLGVGIPTDVALVDEKGMYTYGELREDVDRIAQALLARGMSSVSVEALRGWIRARRMLYCKLPCLVETLQTRQGFRIACIEEVAFRQGYIMAGQLESPGTAASKWIRRLPSRNRRRGEYH